MNGIQGKKILISAGPMRTVLDPVRFIQNRSSGKMGLAIAQACLQAGAKKVSVLLGPVGSDIVKAFMDCEIVRYEGPADYEQGLEKLFPECDVFFSAAAVLDFEGIPPTHKIERATLEKSSTLEVKIKPVPDFIARYGRRKRANQKVIAFAAESGEENEILARAEKKMMKKSADAMIANPVWPGLGPDSEENLVWVLRSGQPTKKIGPDKKAALALPILRAIFEN
jgi:phosphopantothenoylcysteine decarboxylase/phosphopantothenate--cysteine ligase